MNRIPSASGAKSVVATAGVLLAILAGPGSGQTQRPPGAPRGSMESTASGRCGVCHPEERVEFERSRHAREDVRCISCHGGNDRSLELSVAHGADFKGRTARKGIPELCASCHSSEKMMRPYNLPVDQYALYQTSGHGLGLARGDTRVAVCSDCHGAHDILPKTDPASRVFPLNIPRMCGECHGDSTRLRERGAPDVYRAYLSGVHARELLDRGNMRAPTCVSCHGVHGAAPPAVGDVEKVCGQCHTAERRYFVAGPHHAAWNRAGLAECTSCHGDHAIDAAQPERLAAVCAQCHGEGSPQVSVGEQMWTEYSTAAGEIEKAAELTETAEAVPIQTEDYRARLEEARTYLREALPAAHAVQTETVAGFTLRARSVGSEVQSDIYGKLGNLRTRRFVLIFFWFYVLLTIVVLRRFRDRGARAG